MSNLDALKNLDPEALYKAVKVTVKDDTANRYVDKGFEIIGQAETYLDNTGAPRLQVGGYPTLITSPLVKATQDGDNFIIETLNSVYTLEKQD